jgi:hypothetical protein
VITLTYIVAPAIVQQVKRDREAEMIHRGTEYARAIKKFYKKNGRYPSNLDDLDKGQIRFLRRRYTDPLVKDGKFKLLNYGDIATLLNTAAPGVPVGALGQAGAKLSGGATISGVPSAGGASGSAFGALGSNSGAQAVQQLQQQFQSPGAQSGFPISSDQGGSIAIGGAANFLGGSNQPAGAGSDATSASTQISITGATGLGTNPNSQVQGGGAVVGVASVSKDKTIRIYNKKKTYDEWQFIYNPAMDQQNVLLRGPYQPTTIGNTNIGTPASQLNGQQPNGQQNNGFGQPSSGFGQSSSGFGQQGNPSNYAPLGGSSGQTQPPQ